MAVFTVTTQRFCSGAWRWAGLGPVPAFVLTACGGSVGGTGQGADPVIQDLPVMYVSQPLDLGSSGAARGDDLREPAEFRPGARLWFKSQASPSAVPQDLSEKLFPKDSFADETGEVAYDVKHLSPSFDGTRVLFSARAPVTEGVDEETLTWNIWEYDALAGLARRVIASDIVANEGHDLFPAYLPDGRIVFSSTRQRQAKARLLDEGKPQFAALDEDRRTHAFAIHVMDEAGAGIEQITFNQSHDTSPVVRQNGMIAFARWDNAGGNNEQNIYQIRPDGTGLTLLYGNHSHNSGNGGTVQYSGLAEDEDGRLLSILRPFSHSQAGGDAIRVDVENFVDANHPVDQPAATEAVIIPDAQGSLALSEVVTGEGVSLAGRYRAVRPLADGTGRYLVSWTPCRQETTTLNEEGAPVSSQIVPCVSTTESVLAENQTQREANPLYGIWVFDPGAQTMQPILTPVENTRFTDAVILSARSLPDHLSVMTPEDPTAFELGLGVIDIRSVYDWDGSDITGIGLAALADPLQTPPSGLPARYLRIEKPVSLPDEEVLRFPGYAFGFAGNQRMREVVGYVPVAPDGSARFLVPADTALALSITDSYGRRLSARHQNWLQVRAGEVLRCHGCHDPGTTTVHGRLDALPPSVNPGAPTTGLPFPNTRPEWFADMGETMAQTYTRFNGAWTPTLQAYYEDVWTDPQVATPAAAEDAAYTLLSSLPPAPANCLENWQLYCRAVIHYPDHIQPLWTVDRDENTCTGCHSTQDAQGVVQIPAGQLALTAEPSTNEPDVLQAYYELFAQDFEQEVVDGVLQDRTEIVVDSEGNPVFETDENGETLLDAEGNPVPLLRRFPVNPVLSSQGAMASARFFDLFLSGGSHEGRLNRAEIRLIAEWLDIGGQYYNDPFVFNEAQ